MAPPAPGLRKVQNLDGHAIGLAQQPLGKDLVNRSPHGHLAAREHDHRVGDSKDMVRVMG